MAEMISMPEMISVAKMVFVPAKSATLVREAVAGKAMPLKTMLGKPGEMAAGKMTTSSIGKVAAPGPEAASPTKMAAPAPEAAFPTKVAAPAPAEAASPTKMSTASSTMRERDGGRERENAGENQTGE
jgi:hypothetical protein